MGTVLALLAVVLVLFVAAVLATREGHGMAEAPQDAADVVLPPGPLRPEDVAALRFGLAPRGYRMSEVDAVLDRLAAELADRDRRLGLLEATISGSTPAAVAEATPQDLPVVPAEGGGAPADPALTVAPATSALVGPGSAPAPAAPPLSVAEVPTEPAPAPPAHGHAPGSAGAQADVPRS